MRNKTIDLNNHLFAQLEKLSDEDLTSEKLEKEISRTKAIVNIANTIIDSNRTTIEAMKILEKAGCDIRKTGDSILQLS